LAPNGLSEDVYANVANWTTYPDFSDAERDALEYTTKFAADHLAIDQGLMDRLRGHYGDELVFEMTLCIAGWLALGRVTQVMGVAVSCPLTV
jgi:alkylhydroperoxidase family enzyme